MAVDGNGEVSACGRENIGIDLGFRDDVTGATVSISVSVEEEEVDILSDGEDIMVGVSGADIFFDGIYRAEGQEEDLGVVRDDEDEFNDYEIHIDETLEIKDFGVYDVQESNGAGAESSDEIVSCVRAFVQSFPLPGQVSPQELVQSFPLPSQVSPQELVHSFSLPDQISPQELVPVVKPQSFTSENYVEETKDGGIKQPSLVPNRKRKSIEVKPKECGSSGKKQTDVLAYSYMPSRLQEFEDFLNGSTKYSTVEDKTVSQLQMPEQAVAGERSQNLENRLSEDCKTDLPGGCDSLVSQVKDVKDSYWTDMVVIQTESPVKLPTVNSLSGRKVYKSVSTKLNQDVPNKSMGKKTLNYNQVPAAATSDKYSTAELILTFDNKQAIPSESKLYNIFRRFGPLKKTETLIHHESCCARVVFKKRSDAEIAVSSAKSFNIMGQSVVKYELGYTPLSATSVTHIAESEAINPQEFEPEVINDQKYEPQDTPSQQLQYEHLEETSTAGATLESEGYEGLDDVDIME